jgi:SAM-dependent methyltransferase
VQFLHEHDKLINSSSAYQPRYDLRDMESSRQQTLDRLLEATAVAERRHFWFRGLRRFTMPLVTTAVRDLARPRLLDCGCGTGDFLGRLGAVGWAVGTDASAVGLGLAQRAGRGRLVRSDAATLPFRSASFDAAICLDVLYCLEDRARSAALAELFRLLKPEGTLIVTVAALTILRGDHSDVAAEERRFSRSELRLALSSAGFDVVRLTHTNASLVPILLATRWLERRRGTRATSDTLRVPPAPINAILSTVLAAEALWIRRFPLPFGSSLLGLARKPREPREQIIAAAAPLPTSHSPSSPAGHSSCR